MWSNFSKIPEDCLDNIIKYCKDHHLVKRICKSCRLTFIQIEKIRFLNIETSEIQTMNPDERVTIPRFIVEGGCPDCQTIGVVCLPQQPETDRDSVYAPCSSCKESYKNFERGWIYPIWRIDGVRFTADRWDYPLFGCAKCQKIGILLGAPYKSELNSLLSLNSMFFQLKSIERDLGRTHISLYEKKNLSKRHRHQKNRKCHQPKMLKQRNRRYVGLGYRSRR